MKMGVSSEINDLQIRETIFSHFRSILAPQQFSHSFCPATP